MSELVYRKAKVEDLEAVVTLLADDQLGSVRERTGHPLPLIYREAFERMSKQSGNDLIIVEQDNVIIGCMQLTIIHGISRKGMSRCQIEGVRIAKSVRGSGTGERMIKHAIKIAKSKGCGLIQLTTDTRREDAHRFYERLGFVASHVGMKLDLFDA